MGSIYARAELPGVEWPQIQQWLSAARRDDETAILAPGELLFVGRVLQGDPPVGVAVGAATACIDERGAHVVLAGGERAAVLPILTAICVWARAAGAARVFCAGRPGWDRISPFQRVGSDGRTVFYELEL